MPPVYTDASSAILLEKAGLFSPLSRHFTLVLAATVFDEITQPGYPGARVFTAAKDHGALFVESHADLRLAKGFQAIGSLDGGEKDTLCLFLEKRQGFILVDDGKAARLCKKHHLPFINALLVPKLFWYAGLMTEKDCMNKMECLCRLGRYADWVQAFAFGCTKEDLTAFIPEQGHER